MTLTFKSAIAFAFMLASVSAAASDRLERRAAWREDNPNNFSMNFGISGAPAIEGELFSRGKVANLSLYDYGFGERPIIENLYADYQGDIMSTGTIGGEFNWNQSKWFNLSGQLGLCPIWSTTYDGITNQLKSKDFAMAIFLLPKAKIMYCNKPLVRVYSSLAAGVVFLPGFTKVKSPVRGAVQFNFIGIEIGRKWFGSFELGAGTLFMGAQIGFGFKF